jgi:hypothetical protein
MDKPSISKEFHEYALDAWRHFSNKLLRSKTSEYLGVDKKEFTIFSIRWFLQVADTYIRLENYAETEDIYTEIELLCAENIPDYLCIKETLYVRKENLEFLMKHGTLKEEENQQDLQFEQFLTLNNKQPKAIVKSNSEETVVKVVQKRVLFKQLSASAVISNAKKSPVTTNWPLSQPTSSSSNSSGNESSEPKKRLASSAKKAVTKQESSIFIDDSDDSLTQEPPKSQRKATTKVSKTVERSKTKASRIDCVDISKETPTLRRTRRMI